MTSATGPVDAEIDAIKDPRARLVAAASSILLHDLFAIVCKGLQPEHVTSVAGRSRRVFYDHFDDRETVLRSVAERSLTPDERYLANDPEDLGPLLDRIEGDIISGAQMVSDTCFAEQLHSDNPAMRITAWALGRDDPEVRSLLRNHNCTIDEAIATTTERLIAQMGLRFRTPWTGRDIVTVLRALADGLYMRHYTDLPVATADEGPSTQGADAATVDVSTLFARTLACLIPIVTQHGGAADLPVADRLAEFGDAARTAWREVTEVDQLLDARGRVLTALRETIADAGPSIGLEMVAANAGLSMRSVVAAFGTVGELVTAAIAESLPALQREVDFDLAAGDVGLDDMVRRHLLRVSEWVRAEPELASVCYASSTGAVATIDPAVARAFTEEVASPLVAILNEAQRRLDRSPSQHTEQLAAMAISALLAAANCPETDEEENIEMLSLVALRTLELG